MKTQLVSFICRCSSMFGPGKTFGTKSKYIYTYDKYLLIRARLSISMILEKKNLTKGFGNEFWKHEIINY